MDFTRSIAKFIVNNDAEKIPETAFEHAKIAFMDWMGVTLAGKEDPLVAKLINYSDLMGGNEQATILGFDIKKSIAQAALINGAASHALDFDDSLEAMIEPVLFEQAMVNLVDNAVKYSSKKGKIQINAVKIDSGVSCSVEDNGIGISKKHLPRLFERFYRIDKARSREQGGTGLGLAIVKHIIQAHSGHVTVDSTPGKGSTFTINLPG